MPATAPVMAALGSFTGAKRPSLPVRPSVAPAPARSHFDLDDGVPVDEMPWLHWTFLRLGEAMLMAPIGVVGYLAWSALHGIAPGFVG